MNDSGNRMDNQNGVGRNLPYGERIPYAGLNGYNVYDGAYGPEDDPGISWSRYVQAVLYRKWIVIGVFVLAVVAGVYHAYSIKPLYRSEATIEIQKAGPISTGVPFALAFYGHFDLYFQTQIQNLKNTKIADQFLTRIDQLSRQGGTEDVTGSDEGDPSSTNKDHPEEERRRNALIGSVLGRINVTPIERTQLIYVSMTDGDPKRAKQMLGIYLEVFKEEDKRKRNEFAAQLRSWLREELEESEKKLRKSEQDLLNFSAKHGVVFLEGNPDQADTFLEKASRDYYQSKDDRLQLESLEHGKQKLLPARANHEYLTTLKSQLAELKSEYTAKKAVYSPTYFKMVLLESRISSLSNAVSEIEQSTKSESLEVARKREAVAEQAYERSKKKAMEMSPLAVQYQILRQIVEANGKMYVKLLQKYKQAQLDHQIMGHNLVIANAPSLPIAPINLKTRRIILTAVILGLLGGIGIAVAVETFDRTVRSTTEIERKLHVPVLGFVPKVHPGRSIGRGDTSPARDEFMPFRLPWSELADSIRVIQNTAEALMADQSTSTICVSSALPREGKTFVSVSMATAMACDHKKVLLIEGDMRRPRLQDLFGKERGGPGLSDLLKGNVAGLDQVIRRSHIPGLFYIPAGMAADNPVSLLKSQGMRKTLEVCRGKFDFVFVDAPPVVGMADAGILSRYSDGLILVTKQGHTPMEVLRQAQESVMVGQEVRLLGIVLNMVYREANEYDYYASRYGYRYDYRRDRT